MCSTAVRSCVTVSGGKSIEQPGNGSLVSECLPSPRRSERRVRAEAGIDLLEGRAVGQHTDHHIEAFLVWSREDRLAADLDVVPQRREEITLA